MEPHQSQSYDHVAASLGANTPRDAAAVELTDDAEPQLGGFLGMLFCGPGVAPPPDSGHAPGDSFFDMFSLTGGVAECSSVSVAALPSPRDGAHRGRRRVSARE